MKQVTDVRTNRIYNSLLIEEKNLVYLGKNGRSYKVHYQHQPGIPVNI